MSEPTRPPGILLRGVIPPSPGVQRAALAWSCDGTRLATVGRGGCEIWEFVPGGGFRLASALEGDGSRAFQVTWSPIDPDAFVYASASWLKLVRVPAPGARPTPVWRVPYDPTVSYRAAVSFSPDGESIVVADRSRTVEILDTGTGRLRRRLPVDMQAAFVSWSPAGDRIAVAGDDARARLIVPDGSPLGPLLVNLGVVRWVTWSPDARWCGIADDAQIRVLDASGTHRANLEGHFDSLLGISFSHDSRMLYSVGMDGTLRCWSTDSWACVAALDLGDTHHVVGGLAAAPSGSWLARRTQDLARVELYRVDIDRLVTAARPPARSYANAKIVLVGDSGVGKSGLGLVLTGQSYTPTDSTHARQVRTFDEHTVDLPGGGRERRETLLWDLAGQPGYRLVHQLHLAEVAAALVVFDARGETDPFAGVRYWARALRQHGPVPAFLVAARTDRGGVPVSRDRVDALCGELGLAGYFETSAKEGRQIPELAAALRRAVDWTALPRSVSTELFETIQLFLRAERDSDRVLATADDLYALLLRQHPALVSAPALRAGFDTCVRLLELRDLVRRLSFGDFVLLRPELLDSYASALVDAARAQPDGLGYLAEDRALAGDFPIPAEDRLPGAAQRLLLIATVEELLRHDVALREATDAGIDLIFPSQLTVDRPEEPGPGTADVVFQFDGAVQTVYAVLAVRLAHVTAYHRDRMWRNACTYRALAGGVCGLRVREVEEGRGELTVFSAGGASEETRFLFEEYVRTHLEARALPGSVRRDRIFVCTRCGYRLPADLVSRRRDRGDRDMRCPDCEQVRISLLDRRDRLDRADQVRDMNASADAGRDRAAATATIRGKEETRDYDVFLSYHSRDRPAVVAIADRLRAAGVLPWIDQSALEAGDRWHEVLEQRIRGARAGAVLIGPHGTGRWQQMEVQALINESAQRPLRIIPVFLPGTPPDAKLPVFLGQWHAADLRDDNPEGFARLLRAITGAAVLSWA